MLQGKRYKMCICGVFLREIKAYHALAGILGWTGIILAVYIISMCRFYQLSIHSLVDLNNTVEDEL